MRKLARRMLSSYDPQQVEEIVSTLLRFILKKVSPQAVYLFGSATTPYFDEWSDVDVVVVTFDSQQARTFLKLLYSDRALENHSVDFICMPQADFERKSKVGGVAFIAINEGRKIF